MTAAIHWNTSAVHTLLRNPNGVVGVEVFRRATNVQVAARRQVGVRSGRLRRNIVKRGPAPNLRGGQTVLVGSYLPYALTHHQGTPPHDIYPTSKRALRFTVNGTTVIVASAHHPGTRPNRFLTDNLKEALR